MKIYYLILLFLLVSCSNTAEHETTSTSQEVTNRVEEEENFAEDEVFEGEGNDILEPSGDIEVPSFAIKFDFSEEVQEILDSGEESLVIDIALSGLPKDATALMDKDYYNDEDQLIYLANKEIIYQQNEQQTIKIEDLKISEEAFNALNDPDYTIGINFYSSRTTSENNVFSANALIEEVSMMQNKTHTVKVTML